MLIVQTNVHQLTANSPIINTPRNTVKKPRPALNAHEDLPTIATAPLDQVETHKMELDTFNTEGDIAKEYGVYVEYEEYEEYNEEFHTDRSIAKGHINSHEEVISCDLSLPLFQSIIISPTIVEANPLCFHSLALINIKPVDKRIQRVLHSFLFS
jgi:hypothetical protein